MKNIQLYQAAARRIIFGRFGNNNAKFYVALLKTSWR